VIQMPSPIPTLPDIQTERLFLRRLKPEDAAAYHALETDPEVKKFLGGPSTRDVDYYRQRIEENAPGLATTLAVTLKMTGQFLGRCGFTNNRTPEWEINIVLASQYQGQGYGKEIGLALISRVFEALECDEILGVADPANTRSHALCEKLGMKFHRDQTFEGQPMRIYVKRRT
jgi:[ribosomal protein S5]-alanine N-acetyltransferase